MALTDEFSKFSNNVRIAEGKNISNPIALEQGLDYKVPDEYQNSLLSKQQDVIIQKLHDMVQTIELNEDDSERATTGINTLKTKLEIDSKALYSDLVNGRLNEKNWVEKLDDFQRKIDVFIDLYSVDESKASLKKEFKDEIDKLKSTVLENEIKRLDQELKIIGEQQDQKRIAYEANNYLVNQIKRGDNRHDSRAYFERLGKRPDTSPMEWTVVPGTSNKPKEMKGGLFVQDNKFDPNFDCILENKKNPRVRMNYKKGPPQEFTPEWQGLQEARSTTTMKKLYEALDPKKAQDLGVLLAQFLVWMLGTLLSKVKNAPADVKDWYEGKFYAYNDYQKRFDQTRLMEHFAGAQLLNSKTAAPYRYDSELGEKEYPWDNKDTAKKNFEYLKRDFDQVQKLAEGATPIRLNYDLTQARSWIDQIPITEVSQKEKDAFYAEVERHNVNMNSMRTQEEQLQLNANVVPPLTPNTNPVSTVSNINAPSSTIEASVNSSASLLRPENSLNSTLSAPSSEMKLSAAEVSNLNKIEGLISSLREESKVSGINDIDVSFKSSANNGPEFLEKAVQTYTKLLAEGKSDLTQLKTELDNMKDHMNDSTKNIFENAEASNRPAGLSNR